MRWAVPRIAYSQPHESRCRRGSGDFFSGSTYLETAFRLLRHLGTGANLTTDVQIAAHAVELNGEVHSNDGDFARFEGLRWKNPL